MSGTEFVSNHEGRLAAAVLLAAAMARLTGLGELPPFIDESGHIALLNPIHPTFFQLGKVLGQYLYRPVAAISSDPLLGLRMLMAVFGVLTTFGIYLAGRMLGGGAAGLCAGFLWALQPIVTFHDRLALHDPLISLFFIWSVYALLSAVRLENVQMAACAGLLSGLAALVKLPMLPLAASCLVLGFATIPREEWMSRKKLAIGFCGGFLVPMLILIPNAGIVFGGNIYRESGIGAANSSVGLLFGNIGRVFDWLTGYNSIGFVLGAAACAGLAIYRQDPLRMLLLALFAFPVLAMSFVLNVFYARYILATLLPLTLLMGLTIAELACSNEEEEKSE